jgi:hypothetical protein
MTRYLLDTNTISNATKPLPAEALVQWMAEQEDEALFISALSLAEIWRGILEKSAGKKRRELEVVWWTRRATGPLSRTRAGFRREGGARLGPPYVGRRRSRTTEKCSGYGHRVHRSIKQLRSRHGQ